MQIGASDYLAKLPCGTPSPAIPGFCYALVDLRCPPAEGDTTVAVPWSVLQPDGKAGRLILGVSTSSRKGNRPRVSAPGFRWTRNWGIRSCAVRR